MSFLNFIEIGSKPKTKIISVQNNSNNEIAVIKWYAQWRKYCVFFNSETIFDSKCLNEVLNYLDEINKNHKDGRGSNKIQRRI